MSQTLNRFFKSRFQFSLFLLFVIYLVGITTVLMGHADSLMLLTPYNLIFASGLILFNAEKIDKKYLFWFLLLAIAGFLIEFAGIVTGRIFGIYSYGNGLGIKLLEVPLIIGVNWSILVFSTAAIVYSFHWHRVLKAVFAASMMVAYDILLEPVAIRYDFWQWEGGSIPFQNYLAWWVIAFVMLLGVFSFVKKLKNPIAIYVLAVQTLFFAILIVKDGMKVF
ncbi:MAG: carotenoid biosynthesis protein [Bacteroidetes bacterium HGW-Bacteroidetes-1]|jgi:putative membrane protein|nr:MAG: carotenoid biosynthesis protein [Bacteroidetes bacterium HGW-Bacteroidetes-1]